MKKILVILITALITQLSLIAQTGLKPGDEGFNFNLKSVDGKMVSLDSYKNAKGFIIIFSCNHCPYVKMYEDRMIELHSDYAKKGFPVIAINPNDATEYPEDSFENMKIRAKEKGFEFAYLHDETQEVAKRYGAAKTPHVYLLHKESNKYVVKYVGAIDDNYKDAKMVQTKYLEEALNALLDGEAVMTTETKAIGCSIKWK